MSAGGASRPLDWLAVGAGRSACDAVVRLYSAIGASLPAGVMPASFRRECLIGLGRSPCPRLVFIERCRVPENRVDHPPGGLDRIFPRKQRRVAARGVSQKPLIGFHLVGRLVM